MLGDKSLRGIAEQMMQHGTCMTCLQPEIIESVCSNACLASIGDAWTLSSNKEVKVLASIDEALYTQMSFPGHVKRDLHVTYYAESFIR